jgi:hypothetical protein
VHDADSALNKQHGLEHYTRTRKDSASWPKVLLDPDRTFGHHVHDALDLPGYRSKVVKGGYIVPRVKAPHHIVPLEECVRVFHLQNLVKKRWSAKSYYDKMNIDVGPFQWIFDNKAQFSDSST